MQTMPWPSGQGLLFSLPLGDLPVFPSRPIEERFWEKVKKQKNGCWIWTGATSSNGYGHLRQKNQKAISTHRFSWILHRGKVPKGKQVLHDCPKRDNRRCVNPAHLWLGSCKENMEDKVAKGRAARGNKSGKSVLTARQVRQIKRLLLRGVSQSEIARRYSVWQTTISCIDLGKTWTHVTI
jgi:hypothetical protein